MTLHGQFSDAEGEEILATSALADVSNPGESTCDLMCG